MSISKIPTGGKPCKLNQEQKNEETSTPSSLYNSRVTTDTNRIAKKSIPFWGDLLEGIARSRIIRSVVAITIGATLLASNPVGWILTAVAYIVVGGLDFASQLLLPKNRAKLCFELSSIVRLVSNKKVN